MYALGIHVRRDSASGSAYFAICCFYDGGLDALSLGNYLLLK